MKRKKRKTPAPPAAPRRTPSAAWALIVPAVLLGVACAAGGGLWYMRRTLMASPPYADTLARVRLGELPDWLPADIAAGVLDDLQRAAGRRSVFADDLARDVHDAGAANLWVRRVGRVTKRRDGEVLVQAEFRKPFAIARSSDPEVRRPVVVDEEGVVLPLALERLEPYSLIIVAGVQGQPPAPGEKWAGADLADGLRLGKLIQNKPWRREITLINVRNHAARISRIDPDITMVAQVGRGRPTAIHFGRFPDPRVPDYCVSPAQKMMYLDTYYANDGRLAGLGESIELRYDEPYVKPYASPD